MLSYKVSHNLIIFWRRGRDSNPRRALTRSGFQDRRDRPLCHLSGFRCWQGGRDSNPQPTVLETATLPIELPPYLPSSVSPTKKRRGISAPRSKSSECSYAITSVTRPAPM